MTNRPFAVANGGQIAMRWAHNWQHNLIYHVFPAVNPRLHEAKLLGDTRVVLWGTGTPRELAELMRSVVDAVRIAIEWDRSKPEDTCCRLLDVNRLIAMGLRPQIGLEDGIRCACADDLSR